MAPEALENNSKTLTQKKGPECDPVMIGPCTECVPVMCFEQ